MEFLIIYFSGTGNTELLAKEIKKRLENNSHTVELISLEEKEKLQQASFEGKIIGFGFPVYKFSYPDIFNKFFAFFNNAGKNNPGFLFSSYARFPSDSFYTFSKKLNKKSFVITSEESFKCPCCGIASRKEETDFEYQSGVFFEDGIAEKLDVFTNTILKSIGKMKRIRHYPSPLSKISLSLVPLIEKTKYPKLQISKEACSVCGLCAAQCPDNNLINNGTEILIKDEWNCLHCLRCMNHCPSNAVKFGKLTEGNNRYTVQKRDCLYDRAAAGYKEKYWKDFNTIKRQWRKETILYYLKYRKNPQI